MFSQHLPTAKRLPCSIVTSDPATKTVQGFIRSGPVHISVYTTDPLFRWPRTGENWIIRQENGSWYLDSILQDETDKVQITDLAPGDIHLNAPGKIHTSTGTTIARKYTQVVGDGSHTKWTIPHGLNDYAVQVTVVSTGASRAPITAFTWAPVLVEGSGDPNSLIVTFTLAPASKGAEVIVTG